MVVASSSVVAGTSVVASSVVVVASSADSADLGYAGSLVASTVVECGRVVVGSS